MKPLFPLWVGMDREEVAQEAEHRMVAAIRSAERHFHVALSGGRTPQRLYERLAEDLDFNAADWSWIDFFQVDERCVPPEHPGSNFGAIERALFSRAPIPRDRIHRMRGELPPDRAAALAEAEWRDSYPPGNEWPALDFVILGMGADGHTASLFPETEALTERERWVAANYVPQMDSWRLTLTLPVLERAAAGIVLVTGEDKAETLMHVMNPELQLDVPIRRLMQAAPQYTFLVDRDAASGLELPEAEEVP